MTWTGLVKYASALRALSTPARVLALATANEEIHRRLDRLEASVDAALSICDEELESWAFHRGNASLLRASTSPYHHHHHHQHGYELGSDHINHIDSHNDNDTQVGGLSTPTRWSEGVMYSLRLSDLAGVGSTRTLEDIAVNGVSPFPFATPSLVDKLCLTYTYSHTHSPSRARTHSHTRTSTHTHTHSHNHRPR